jgi:NAD(P)-dependent dehydrogenase (short-subunit alcohol dehydrogenase family)
MANSRKGAVLVTGTSVGIGRAIALLLDRTGYRVFAGVRRTEDGETLRREASAQFTPLLLDVTNAAQIAEAARTIEKALGPEEGLTALVNNAGIVVAGPLEFLALSDIRKMLEVNVVGQMAVIQAVLPLLRRGQKGRILQITSAGRNLGMPFLGAYVASKAGIGAMCDSLRRELRAEKLYVSEILPGFVVTPMWDKYREPADRLQETIQASASPQAQTFAKGRKLFERVNSLGGESPEGVAKVVLRALEARHPSTHYRVGMDARLGLAVPRLMPARVMDWIVARVLK